MNSVQYNGVLPECQAFFRNGGLGVDAVFTGQGHRIFTRYRQRKSPRNRTISRGSWRFSKCLKMISGFPDALLDVLNGLRRTMADARHTVGAVAAPDRPAILERDVVCWAEPDTLAAAGAGIAGRKRFRFDKERIEDWIHRAAHEAVVKVIAERRECLTSRNGGDYAVNVRFRPGDDLPRLLRLGCVEHGNVILRHNNLRCPHVNANLKL